MIYQYPLSENAWRLPQQEPTSISEIEQANCKYNMPCYQDRARTFGRGTVRRGTVRRKKMLVSVILG